jgi:hypothetical protein
MLKESGEDWNECGELAPDAPGEQVGGEGDSRSTDFRAVRGVHLSVAAPTRRITRGLAATLATHGTRNR